MGGVGMGMGIKKLLVRMSKLFFFWTIKLFLWGEP